MVKFVENHKNVYKHKIRDGGCLWGVRGGVEKEWDHSGARGSFKGLRHVLLYLNI